MFEDQTTNFAPPANLPTEPEDMFAGVDNAAEPPIASTPNALQAGVLKPKTTPIDPHHASPIKGGGTSVITPPFQGGGEGVVTSPQMYTVKEPVVGKIILIVVLLAVLGGAGYFGYRLYAKGFFSGTTNNTIAPTSPSPSPRAGEGTTTPTAPPIVAETPVVETPLDETPVIIPTNTTTAEAPADMASDEILFGEGVDTDKDGLDDVRENEIKTSPYKSDTDGDELSDGDEVIIWKTDPLNPDTDKDTYKDGEEVKNSYNPLGPGKLFNVPTTTAK